MPASYVRAVVTAVAVFVVTFSPYAHAAQTAALAINDPFTDAIQLWSAVLSSIDSLAHEIAAGLASPQAVTNSTPLHPHAPKNSTPPVLSAAAAVPTESLSETPATSVRNQSTSVIPQQPQSRSPPRSASTATTIDPPLAPAVSASAFVTQEQYNAGMSALGQSLRQLILQTESQPVVSGFGAPLSAEAFAPSQAIDQLSGATLSNITVHGVSGLAASDIPALAYLPLTGGTLSGDLSLSGTLTAGTLNVGGLASSGALVGPYFTATSTSATSSIAGAFSVSGSASLATTTITGGLTVNGNTNITQGGELTVGDKVIAPGEIGLGTTSPYAKLAVQGTLSNQTVLALVGTTSQSSPFLDIFSNAGANLFRITSAGNVGIGQANPTYALDTSGAGHFTSFVDAANFVATSSSATSLFNGNLTVNGGTTLGNATTTNLFATNASTTNLTAASATSTTLFSAIGNFTTGLINTLSGTQLTYNAASTTNATTTNLAVTGTASTSNLVASTGFTFKNVTGFLKATAGVVGTSLVNLASDVTGTLPVGNGGTGWANVAAGAIPYGNGGSALATTSAGTAGQVLALLNGVPTWTATTTLSTISGTLAVADGGTGSTTMTGILKGNGTGSVQTAIAGTDYLAPASLSGTEPITYNSGTGAIGFDLTHANDWTGLQQFSNASTSIFSAYGPAYFGGSATSSFGSDGTLTLAKTFAANGTSGTSTIASGQGFTIGGSQFVVQQGSGNVGIGTSSPQAVLNLTTVSNSGIDTAFLINRPDDYGGYKFAIVHSNIDTLLQQTTDDNPGQTALAVNIINNGGGALGNVNLFGVQNNGSTKVIVSASGNLGIGTSSPDTLLTVGSATPSGNVAHFENSTGSCYINPTTTSLSCSSDQRLKNNIQPIDASSTLAGILDLEPVSYNWNSEPTGAPPHTGFIAQSVQPIFPDLVSQGPDGYYTLNYAGFAPYIIKAVQDIANITSTFQQNLIAWLGNSENGITDLFVQNGHFSSELCVGSTCVTPAQFQAMVAAVNASQSGGSPASSSSDSNASTTPDTPPVIQINGDNPAIIQVGNGYTDLGATITGPQADLNLGITTYVNGAEMTPVQIDTSAAATDTIYYVATDQSGLMSTSTRTVIIEASPSIAPTGNASTTAASTTPQ